MSNRDSGENLYTGLVKKQKNNFLYFYKIAYTGEHGNIYKLKTDQELTIKRNNDKLYFGNNEFKIKGVNSYDLAYKTDTEIEQNFQEFNKAKINTVRFWMFGDGDKDGFQPDAGIINENRFHSVDVIIANAEKYHIKLIPVLLNNWEDYGGRNQYLEWVGIKASEDTDFYGNTNTRRLYENYINHVLSRKNKINNKTYAEEPAILAWDMMNEPRINNDKENKSINPWVNEISKYISQHDKAGHLITIGTEKINKTSDKKQPLQLCSLNTIDICSIHLYLFTDDKPIYQNENQIIKELSEEKKYAYSIKKPIIVEEFGVSKKTKPFNLNPVSEMDKLSAQIMKLKFNGILVWNWSLSSDTSFGFSPTGDDVGNYSVKDLNSILN